jgi:integral membrane sensor domain MASE1
MTVGRHARLAWLSALFVVYVGASVRGETVMKIGNVAPIWPASGVAVAGVLLLGRRAAPVIFVADLTATWIGPPALSLPVASGTALANVLEALVVAWILERLRFDLSLRRWRDVLLLVCASVIGASLGATLGVAVLAAAHEIGSVRLAWRSWAPSDVVGGIVSLQVFLGVCGSPDFGALGGRWGTEVLVLEPVRIALQDHQGNAGAYRLTVRCPPLPPGGSYLLANVLQAPA